MINDTDSQIILKYIYLTGILTKYISMILYIFCLFGTIMNVLTFVQRTYNSRACSLYLLVASIADLIHINIGSLSNILQYGYHYDWTRNLIYFCKIKSYLIYVFTILSATFSILASIDRYILSSRKTHRWKFSNQALAIRCIYLTIFVWLILSIPLIFCFKYNNQFVCTNQSESIPCFLLQILYTCILNGLIPPIIMLYFGFLTHMNIANLRKRYINNVNCIQKINYQLTSMLILQSIKSSFTSLPYTIFNCYLLITINLDKSLIYQVKENFVHQIVYLFFLSNYTSFFIYFYSSDIFRQQCLLAIKKILCCFYNDKQKRIYFNQQMELKRLTMTTNVVSRNYKPSEIFR